MKKAWIIAGSIVGVIVLAIVISLVVDMCVLTRAEAAECLVYEKWDEINERFSKDAKEKNVSVKVYDDFFMVEDVTEIGQNEDNESYFLVTYRLNESELMSSVVMVGEKNGMCWAAFCGDSPAEGFSALWDFAESL